MSCRAHDTLVPDLVLPGATGGTVNPADFRGQRLALFVCPEDPALAAREIEAWRALADHFQDAGVWLLGVAQDGVPMECLADKAGRHVTIARDSDSRLRSLLMPCLASTTDPAPDASAGAAFLFERWGCLDRGWAASGHAKDVLRAATEHQ
jgi:peroxiredoxin